MPVREEQISAILSLYNGGWSTTQISKKLGGMSAEGVRYTLQKMGVKLRTLSEAFNELGNWPDSKHLSEKQKQQIQQLYASGLSLNQIADHFGVTAAAIRYHLKKQSISRRTISESRKIRCQDSDVKNRASEIHKEMWKDPNYREKTISAIERGKIAFSCDEAKMSRLKGALAGMLLGDGGLHIQKGGRHASFNMTHTMKQQPYLEHKVQLMRLITVVNVFEHKPSGKNPNVQSSAKSYTNPFYTEIYSCVYPGGKKVVSREWLEWLTIEGLALWYMDDGSLNKKRYARLSTCGFSYAENELLCKFLKERFGLLFSIYSTSSSECQTYYSLRASAEATKQFVELIRPYVVPCMQYKIDVNYDKK